MSQSVTRFSLLACGALALTARAELVDRVAAVVNADIIALSEVEARAAPELARLRNELDPSRRGEQRATILKRVLDGLIGEKLMDAQVRELNIEVSDAEVDLGIDDVKRQNNVEGAQFEQLLAQEGYTLPAFRAFMKKHLSKLKLVNLKVRSKVKVTDEDLKAEYAKLSRDETQDFEVRARHVLVQVQAKATPEQVEQARLKAVQLMAEAKKPGVDFAALAKAKSEGPSAADGGDLGFFKRGVMVAEFDRVAFGLPPGGISEPVRTKFGWHVIKVEERRSSPPKPFDEVRDALRDRLTRAQLEKYTDQYVQELRAGATVDVKI
ncbi:MAG: peptidylprolyl isomerase [Myxococcaceae bacterium]|nr:peptidylprolyl isomerase [Myxococcaceae bacterium]MCA3016556.1 peptidylprolyl isomerase [Myxococcaceae bacterium]